MSFQTIHKIEKFQTYLDIAFRRAAVAKVSVTGSPLYRAKEKEKDKLSIINETLASKLNIILKEFPGIEKLPEFYAELLKITLDYERLKAALRDVNWANHQVRELYKIHRNRMRACKDVSDIETVKKAFLGRVSSVIRQISQSLAFLESSRRIIMDYPPIKTGLPTICIAGFPNVGKSTLLGKLTTSKPEIKNYAFTTKRLNLGYTTMEFGQVQFIDTPGTLARPEKMNDIEKQAFLALKYQADVIIFIFDPTDTYPTEQQEQLLDIIKESKKPLIIYISKADIADKKTVQAFVKEYDAVADVDSLINRIRSELKEK
ncbi:MAG: GTPase [archaeon]